MSTMALDGSSAPIARSRTRGFEAFLYRFSVVAFILYALRDAFTGSIRYYFNMFGLNSVWFVPDIMSFACFFMFFYYGVTRKSSLIIYFCYLYIFSAVVSIFYMNDNFFSFFSSLKMVSPMFVGLCLFGRDITADRWIRAVIFATFVLSAVGILLSSYIEFPWVGQRMDNFGVQKLVGKLWWAEGEIRYGGFAGDSTMAAFMVVFPFFMVAKYLPFLVNLLLWPLVVWSVQVSTSKTALVVFVLFALIYIFLSVAPKRRRTDYLRNMTRLSFLCVFVPFILIIVASGADLGAISAKLASMSDRINNSWQLPFVYLNDIFPASFYIGCGLGCFSYPMDYTSYAKFAVPVDNFYLTTYLMMGIPFIALVYAIYHKVNEFTDWTKMYVLLIFNFYSITVQCYGPSFATLLFGYMVSDAFVSSRRSKGERAPEATSRLAIRRPARGPVGSKLGFARRSPASGA